MPISCSAPSHRPAAALSWRLAWPVGALLALNGCGALPTAAPGDAPARLEQSVSGNYEAIGGCVAEVDRSAPGGGPQLTLNRAAKVLTLRRVSGPALDTDYTITFTQTGAGTVQAVGQAAPGSRDGAAILQRRWTHVAQCAAHMTAP
jgi:hypothetical protein